MVPTLVENSKFFMYLFVTCFFVNNFIMTGEPTHTASEMARGFKSDSSTPLKSLSKMITPSVQLFSKHYPKRFIW